jgi:lipopolysaccharide export system permease protein
MRLHDRYFLRELITPLAFCLGAFLVLGISLFFKEELNTIQDRKLDGLETAAYCAASLPEFLVVILPILLLLSMLYALTHHARHNEITALRAAGVSLWRVCAPYFAVGLLATGVYFTLNEVAVPACNRWAQRILNRHVKSEDLPGIQPHGLRSVINTRARRNWQFTEYDEHTSRMLNPTVTWTLPDGSWYELRASRAVRTNGVWTFFEVEPQCKKPGPHSEAVRLPRAEVLAMPEFDETPERIQLLLKFADTQTLHASGSADIPLAELWQFLQNQADLRPEDANALQTKFYGRLAAPWTCFVVVLMAIPFGAPSGRRNLFFGVAGSIFIGFTYFVLQKVSLALGMNGQLPGWLAAWLPNWLFAAGGLWLIGRVR